MRMVQQNAPNDVIAIRTDDNSYVDTQENFEKDYGSAFPALPEGITQRIYEPDKRHALSRGDSVVAGGPMPWSDGDNLLTVVDQLVVKQKAREVAEEKERAAKVRAEEAVRYAEATAKMESYNASSRSRSK